MMRKHLLGLAMAVMTVLGVGRVQAEESMTTTQLKPFKVTVRIFDPARGLEGGKDYVLPVDSPDAEHAASSTMANAVAFTKKIEGGKALSVGFACIKVEPR